MRISEVGRTRESEAGVRSPEIVNYLGHVCKEISDSCRPC